VLILGAAGRDFHNFNVVYRDDPATEVVAFTAAQVPGIAGRRYPSALAGPRYPGGIPIEPEDAFETLVREHAVDLVVFAYSDVSHEHVMHLASRALAAGADFALLGPRRTMLPTTRPVVAVTAVRTGCGKGAVSRRLVEILRGRGWRVAIVRHPMPYGDLLAQRVQRFATLADLDRAGVTLEEREEYEPHLAMGRRVGPASTTRRSSSALKPRPASSSGTAGTTTSRSSRPPSTSVSSIPTGPGMNRASIPGRRICGSQTSWSS
jgi:predicted GTPase